MRHGNYRHGERRKDHIAGMREVRFLKRQLRCGLAYVPCLPTPPCPPGWGAYRAARDGLPAPPAPVLDATCPLGELLRIMRGG